MDLDAPDTPYTDNRLSLFDLFGQLLQKLHFQGFIFKSLDGLMIRHYLFFFQQFRLFPSLSTSLFVFAIYYQQIYYNGHT